MRLGFPGRVDLPDQTGKILKNKELENISGSLLRYGTGLYGQIGKRCYHPASRRVCRQPRLRWQNPAIWQDQVVILAEVNGRPSPDQHN